MEQLEWAALRDRIKPEHTVLDIGCRRLPVTRWQLYHVERVDGFDPNPADSGTPEGNILGVWAHPPKYDVVIMKRVLCNIEPQRQHDALVNAWSFVRKGGRLMVIDPHVYSRGELNRKRAEVGLKVLEYPDHNYPVRPDSIPSCDDERTYDIGSDYYVWTRLFAPMFMGHDISYQSKLRDLFPRMNQRGFGHRLTVYRKGV